MASRRKKDQPAARPAPSVGPVNAAWSPDKIEVRSPDQLRPWDLNPRRHPQSQLDLLAARYRAAGFTHPILVHADGRIIAGHGRWQAAQQAGLVSVPVIVAPAEWSDEDCQREVLADNQIALLSDWDDDAMREAARRVIASGGSLEELGFQAVDISEYLAERTAGLTDPDDAPEPPAVPVSRLGDLWQLGSHRLICGDSTSAEDVAQVLGDVSPHLMVTDPPYGVEYDPNWRAVAGVNNNKDKLGKVENDGRSDWRESWVLFPGDVAYCWHAGRHASSVQSSLEAAGFVVRCQIIWAKDRFALSRGDYHWQHEPCWYAVREKKTGHWAGDRKQSTLWSIPAREDKGHGHGTQKPVECMRRPIENNSSPGQAVYEPFSGSGTTIIAAEMTGRACHAIELNPAYVDVAIKRWQDFTGRKATLDGDGRDFESVAAERVAQAAA